MRTAQGDSESDDGSYIDDTEGEGESDGEGGADEVRFTGGAAADASAGAHVPAAYGVVLEVRQGGRGERFSIRDTRC